MISDTCTVHASDSSVRVWFCFFSHRQAGIIGDIPASDPLCSGTLGRGKVLRFTENFVWEWISGGIMETPRECINCRRILLKCVRPELKTHRSTQLDLHSRKKVVALTQQAGPMLSSYPEYLYKFPNTRDQRRASPIIGPCLDPKLKIKQILASETWETGHQGITHPWEEVPKNTGIRKI